MTITRCYRIVDYIGEFYVQYQDAEDGASIPEDAWEELLVVEEDTPATEVASEMLRECIRLNLELHGARQTLGLKQHALTAQLQAHDAAQAEIKRLQGLLDAKHKPGFGLSKEQADHLRVLARNHGHACFNATETERHWKYIDDALHNYTKE